MSVPPDPYASGPDRRDPYAGPQGGPFGQGDPYAQGGRAPMSGGGMFPFPHRSWRTRGGSQVTVGGCCLPLPIGCLTTVALAGVAAYAAARHR